MLLIVTRDTRLRAPASVGDALGIMNLGAVMQNLWLMAEARGLSMQILSVLSGAEVEPRLRTILAIAPEIGIAFGCRLGYPAAPPSPYLRVRRPVREFVYRNRCGPRAQEPTGQRARFSIRRDDFRGRDTAAIRVWALPPVSTARAAPARREAKAPE